MPEIVNFIVNRTIFEAQIPFQWQFWLLYESDRSELLGQLAKQKVISVQIMITTRAPRENMPRLAVRFEFSHQVLG